ncbi:hypothetical protein NXY02_05525 [Bacteroides fragilis]|nr:hypothetical protein [Bacteroides fragilis]
MRGLIVSAFMLLGCIQAFGQESRKEVCIGFPVGDSTLDTAYGDNATRLSEVVSFLESVKKTIHSNWSECLFAVPLHPRADLQ